MPIISMCRLSTTVSASIRPAGAAVWVCEASRSVSGNCAARWRSAWRRRPAERRWRSICRCRRVSWRCRVRVLLADDHSIVRRGLRSLLEEAGHSVVAEAADGLDAVRLCEEHRPDLVILDIAMPHLNGIEVAARAQKLDRPPGVIMLSMHADESYILRALAAGARAYLLKNATDEDLLPALQAVGAGKPFFSPAVTGV